ncbi:MAG: hypothetical protein IJY39_03910 [Clostridia bacterium]|nr:hypothetical protein [Clostridia bacterium]
MKTKIKLLALVMALLMVFSALVACDSGKEEETDDKQVENLGSSETETEVETEAKPEIAENDYGTEFYLSVLPDVNPMKYYWVEESDNDVMSEALFARQQKVLEYLGVEIMGSLAGNYQTYTEGFKTAVKNKDGSVDTLITHVDTGVSGLVTEAYLRSFDNMPGIDLEQDHWNASFMDALSIADKHYLGFSDFNILYTHVITFNKDMLDKYADALEVSVYDMVRDYTWTLDQMIELVNLVYIDTTSDGKTDDDTFGLVGMQWVPWIGFLHASNINLVDMDASGQYKVSVMNDLNKQKTSELVDKLTELSKSNSTYLDYMTAAGSTISLTSGRALMQLTPTIGIADFLDYDISFGVLPYPMWDEAQKDVGYRHLQWGGYLCIPNYLANENITGETLEVLSFYSKDVQTAFYEKLLGKQVADVPDDSQMLSIVWDTVCTDFGQTFSGECPGFLYMLPHVTWPESGQELASFVKQYESSANKSLSKFLKKMEKIGAN